jgi:hypothetical protein
MVEVEAGQEGTGAVLGKPTLRQSLDWRAKPSGWFR